MRVRTYHRHTVSRSSTLLNALMVAHVIYSFAFTTPVFFTYLGINWSSITGGQRAWIMCVLLLWFFIEIPRLFLGFSSNKRMCLSDQVGFLCLTAVPQIVLLSVYYSLVPNRNDLEYSICVTQFILLSAEALASIRLLSRLGSNNTIDFYVSLGGEGA